MHEYPEMNERQHRAALWFRRVMSLGIMVNVSLAVPTLLVPAAMARWTGLPLPQPDIWLRFAALLLILLSAFYAPAGVDPNRYRVMAWLAVASRLAGGIFFVVFQSSEYRVFGYLDLALFVPLLLLLLRIATTVDAEDSPFTVRSGVVQ